MSKVTLKVNLDFEELRKAISKFSDDEKKFPFFELTLAQSKALQKMAKEALKNFKEGKTVPLNEV